VLVLLGATAAQSVLGRAGDEASRRAAYSAFVDDLKVVADLL